MTPVDLDAMEARARDASACVSSRDMNIWQTADDCLTLIAECRRLQAEVAAQHDEHVARYGQAVNAEERAEQAEVKLAEATERLKIETQVACNQFNLTQQAEARVKELERAYELSDCSKRKLIDEMRLQRERAEKAEARVKELERSIANDVGDWEDRAVWAEARVAVLREALSRIAKGDTGEGSSKIARVALATTDAAAEKLLKRLEAAERVAYLGRECIDSPDEYYEALEAWRRAAEGREEEK